MTDPTLQPNLEEAIKRFTGRRVKINASRRAWLQEHQVGWEFFETDDWEDPRIVAIRVVDAHGEPWAAVAACTKYGKVAIELLPVDELTIESPTSPAQSEIDHPALAEQLEDARAELGAWTRQQAESARMCIEWSTKVVDLEREFTCAEVFGPNHSEVDRLKTDLTGALADRELFLTQRNNLREQANGAWGLAETRADRDALLRQLAEAQAETAALREKQTKAVAALEIPHKKVHEGPRLTQKLEGDFTPVGSVSNVKITDHDPR